MSKCCVSERGDIVHCGDAYINPAPVFVMSAGQGILGLTSIKLEVGAESLPATK